MNVLITGGNGGLGFQFIKVFSETGNKVAAIVRSESAKKIIKKQFPQCTVLLSDITSYAQLKKIKFFENHRLDILINNAGKASSGVSITDSESDEIEKQFMVHCLGAFNVTKVAYPSLAKSERPLIINISSRLGSMSRNEQGEFIGKGFSYGYRIGKGAQNMLTQCLSQELGPKGFRVCALHPGRLLTSSGATDAHMTPYESAQKIHDLIVKNQIENGGYYCIETGTMQW